MTLVVDASVALMWLVDEPLTPHALRVRYYALPHVAPQHLRVEVAAAIRKKLRTGDIQPEHLPAAIDLLNALPVDELPVGPLISHALQIAVRFNCSTYDALYVALALESGCQFVTADGKLHRNLAAAYPETLLWVEDVPA